MACGDKYNAEVVTVDGYTVANPYGMVAFPGDYTGWRQLAERIFDRLNVRWQQLGEVEEEHGYEFWNNNVEDKNLLWERVDDLPSTIVAAATGAGITGGIDESMKVIVDMNCFRETVDDRLVELDVKPKELPGPGVPEPAGPHPGYPLGIHWGWWLGGGVVLTAAAVGTGYYVAARARFPDVPRRALPKPKSRAPRRARR